MARTPAVAPAPNGIAFLPEYKDWKAISSTERFDNHTMRVILGNDAAVKAIAENHINPWPDGTAFAKVAWLQQPDEKGLVRTGAFFQVEFMIRDSEKYAGTKGWGWARWRGADLKPYGKDATFAKECIGCHDPLSRYELCVYRSNSRSTVKALRKGICFLAGTLLFSMSLLSLFACSGAKTKISATLNQSASLVGELPANPLQWKVITSAVNHADSTMSTLYGNDLAVKYARAGTRSTVTQVDQCFPW